jgi:hypothetical protein
LSKGNTMHRDISAGNILIYLDKNGVYRGLLADWDLCKLVTVDFSRMTHRTGTWQFGKEYLLHVHHRQLTRCQ